MELYCGLILMNCIKESNYGNTLQNHVRVSYYGVPLRIDIIDSFYRNIYIYDEIILRNYPVERNPGIPGTSPAPPGNPGTPWGPCWDLPRTTQTATAQQNYSSRSSRLLHTNPFVATHHSEDPLDC